MRLLDRVASYQLMRLSYQRLTKVDVLNENEFLGCLTSYQLMRLSYQNLTEHMHGLNENEFLDCLAICSYRSSACLKTFSCCTESNCITYLLKYCMVEN
jgi:hypothetical protein